MQAANQPKHPGKALTWALQLGLTATVALLRERVTEGTRHLYEGGKGCKGVRKLWKEARGAFLHSKRRGEPNAKFLQEVEKNIRRSFLIFILTSAVRYGNEEEKRKRRNEDRKYINTLLDFVGARLRDIGVERFKFPTPMRTVLPNGFSIRVYPGNTRVPEYQPSHTVPELDFMDMIRSHCMELVRQCLKYNVPRGDAQAYIEELIRRLLPYLEWVYTERRKGKGGFLRNGMRDLRAVTTQMQLQYGTFNGRPQSVTGALRESRNRRDEGLELLQEMRESDEHPSAQEASLDFSDKSLSAATDEEHELFATFWRNLLERSFDSSKNLPGWKSHLAKLRELANIYDGRKRTTRSKKAILTERDSKHLYELLREESRRVGVAFHDYLANANYTVRAFDLYTLVRFGDRIINGSSEWMLAAEVPIADGTGRIDLILFRRKLIAFADNRTPSHLWEPCMLIEAKTKSAFNIDLYAIPTRSKKHPERRVVHFDYERRRLTQDEWDRVLSSTPREKTIDQIAAYERYLLSEYRILGREDSTPPESLLKGILVVDSRENWDTIREHLLNLVVGAFNDCKGRALQGRELFCPMDKEDDFHAGLIVFGGSSSDVTTSRPSHIPSFDPFRHSQGRNDSRRFTLYFPVAGKGSSQRSAARISALWHGIRHINHEALRMGTQVIWLDLNGDYADLSRRKRMLYLNLRPKSVQRFAKWGITFVDLAQELSCFIAGRTSLEDVICKSTESLKEGSLIVVTDMDSIRERTPFRQRTLLEEYILYLIKSIPEQSSVIWFDSPAPLVQTSQTYDMRCLTPFYPGSPWQYLVDEIIWNLPMAPKRAGSYSPVDDDVRAIIFERPDAVRRELITVPPLHKWGERFRTDKEREENLDSRRTVFLKGAYATIAKQSLRRYDQSDIDATLELLPHLNIHGRPHPDGGLVKREILPLERVPPPSLLSMTSFTPYQTRVLGPWNSRARRKGRGPRLEPFERINHQRRYRRTLLRNIPPQSSTRPPHLGLLLYESTSQREMVEQEVKGLRATVRLLKGRGHQLNGLLDSLNNLLEQRALKAGQESSIITLRSVTKLFAQHEESKDIWAALRPLRLQRPRGLNPQASEDMFRLQVCYPGLLLLTGNQFFLLLLAALEKTGFLEAPTGALEELWKYLLPWHLTTIGFAPHYHAQHRTGRSALNRGRVLDVLSRRIERRVDTTLQGVPTEVLFGLIIPVDRTKGGKGSQVWLVFQSRPGSHEMNACLLQLKPAEEWSLLSLLQDVIGERPYWGETDLTLLRNCAKRTDVSKGVPVMVAKHQGIRSLWIHDPEERGWVPVARFDYRTRVKEDVTLLQYFTLRKDLTQRFIDASQVRPLPNELADDIMQALGIIRRAYEDIKATKCRVSIDKDQGMYILEFSDPGDSGTVFGRLQVKRTRDVIELLRRPSFECEPLEVNGHRLVLDRFDEAAVEYDSITALLRPWVERRDPFPLTEINLPPTAEGLARARRITGLELRVTHDAGICTMARPLPVLRFKDQQERDSYLKELEGHPAQPDSLYFESTKGHGACWRVIPSGDGVPEEVSRLQEVPLKGQAVATLLRTGALVYQRENEWVIHEFVAPQAERLPREFRESYSLVLLYRQMVSEAVEGQKRTGIHIPKLEERWVVSLAWSTDHIVWSARSTTTNELYKGTTFTIRLDRDVSLEKAFKSIMIGVTAVIPEERIREFDKLQEAVMRVLKARGYRTSKRCEAAVSVRDGTVRVMVYRPGEIGAGQSITLEVRKGTTVEEVWGTLHQRMGECGFEGYSFKQEHRVRSAVREAMQDIADGHGWGRVHETKDRDAGDATRPMDGWTVLVECTRNEEEMRRLKEEGELARALAVIDRNLRLLGTVSQEDRSFVGPTVISQLLERVDILTDPRYEGAASPELLLQDLDRIHELVYLVGPTLRHGGSPFQRRVRKALDLRERLNQRES